MPLKLPFRVRAQMPQPAHVRRSSLRLATWGLAAFAVYMLVLFAGLVVQSYHMEQQKLRSMAETALLEQQNRDLQARRDFVQSDASLERTAREKLNMARPDDVVLQVQPIEPTPAAPDVQTTPTPAPVATPDPPNWRQWWTMVFGSKQPN